MSEVEYSIVCYGEILEGFDREQVKKNLAVLFKQPIDKMERLLERSGITLKTGLDELRAKQYMKSLARAGLKVRAERIGAAAAASASAQRGASQAAARSVPKTKPSPVQQTAGKEQAGDEAVEESRMVHFIFNGQGGEYFRIWIVNLFLSILTLGIYSAWAKVRNKQYFYGNMELDGSTFEYTGNPVAILKGRAIAGSFFILYTAVGQLFPLIGLVMFLLLLIAMPWIVTRSLMFNARNSVYRNVRLHFHGSTKEAIFAFALWPLAGVISLGLLAPLAFYKQQRFFVENHSYGTTRFKFGAEAKDYYRIFVIMFLTIIGGFIGSIILASAASLPGPLILLPVYLFVFIYFSVNVFNLRFNNSQLGEHGFQAYMKLGTYTQLVVINTLATVVTLGLFRPWAMVRTARYKAEHLSLQAKDDLGNFIAQEEEQVSALGEEAGDMFDFDIGL